MATLILTTVGTAIGGPIGGAIGALAGRALDGMLLAPGGSRQGPRLTDLAVQTSTYGAPIPKVFGTMRCAGSVIWSTDLIEHATTTGGGKRGPSQTNYSYSASFAVLLSARPILGVRRIWADGNLLRGAAGDFKSATGFRLYLGSEDQAIDPLIASAEGASAPAHRGLAYAVFEDMALADFGNRIPSLTFEIEADAAAVASGAIAAEVSGGLVAFDAGTRAFAGYCAYGDNARVVVDQLATAAGGWLAADGEAMRFSAGAGETREIVDQGASTDARAGVRSDRAIAAPDAAAKQVALAYHDVARDFQAGLQTASRPGAGWRAERIELPAALAADDAKTIAADALSRWDVERERRSVTLDWRAIDVAPGQRVRIAGEAGVWRVRAATLERMVVRLDLVRLAPAPLSHAAAPGRVLASPDAAIGDTIIHAFEIPPLDGSTLTRPRLTVVAGGTGAGWRGTSVQVSMDAGVTWVDAGVIRRPAILGALAASLAPAGSHRIDRRNAIEVEVIADWMTLAPADWAALDRGANLAVVCSELVQFETAERISARRWRLSGLWRGRHGTEAQAGWPGGSSFALLDGAELLAVDLPDAAAGTSVRCLASGIWPGGGATADALLSGASVAPPSPCGARATISGGIVHLSWRRRSRRGWQWIDGVDAPLVEEAERYRITIHRADGSTLESESAATSASVSVTGPAPIIAEVRQVGTYGLSPPASAAIL